MSEKIRIGIAVLASGSAERFGENKLLTLFGGKALFAYCLAAVPEACRADAAVFTCHPEVAELAEGSGFRCIYNGRAAEGISAGIRLAVSEFRDRDGILFLVADQPLLREQTVARILDAFREDPDAIVCAALDGSPMNPCLFPKHRFAELEALRGDRGGKRIVLAHPEELLPVPGSPEEFADCDTPEQLAALTAFLPAPEES